MSVVQISAAVGANAPNRHNDVVKVQTMLVHFIALGKLKGTKKLKIDGICGPMTKQAIASFQFENGLVSEEHFNNQIRPGGISIVFMNQNAGSVGTKTISPYILGIDVSKHQGEISWEEVAGSDCEFVFIKATEGVGYTDPRFAENWSNVEYYTSLLHGAYHFARVSKGTHLSIEEDAKQEAGAFSKALYKAGYSGKNLHPVLDIEWDKRAKEIKAADLLTWVSTFLSSMQVHMGRSCIIYTGKNYWRYKLNKTSDFSGETLWQADYHTIRRKIPGWNATFWQYSSQGKVPGIEGNVDMNKFFGSRDMLARRFTEPWLW